MNSHRQVPLNSWGNVIDPYNDPMIQNIMDNNAVFPRRLLQRSMDILIEIINSVVDRPIIFDRTEPLSPLIWLQSYQCSLIKSCILNLQSIEDYITMLARTPLHSRSDITTVRLNAIPAVELWEIATLSAPATKHMEFIRKSSSYLRDLNTKYPSESDRARIHKQLGSN